MSNPAFRCSSSSSCSAIRSSVGGTKLKTLRYLALMWLSIAFAPPAPAQAEGKIGYVNLPRILREAAPAQRAQKKLESEFSKREQELGKVADSLKRMQESLDKNLMTMSESDRRSR